MIYGRNTLFKALDGVTSPIAVPPYRYPVGRWTKHLDPATLEPCHVGYHLARGPMLLNYMETALYVAEPCPEHGLLESVGQLLTCRARLVERVSTWDGRVARLFAADVAEAVLLGERACGREIADRSWAAVDAARKYADMLIGFDELDAARHAATLAVIVEEGARPTIRGTAWVAARTTVADDYSAAWYTVSAASEAAYDGAYRDGDVRTWREARKAAKSVMFDRLLMYLNDEPLPPVEPLYEPAAERSTR